MWRGRELFTRPWLDVENQAIGSGPRPYPDPAPTANASASIPIAPARLICICFMSIAAHRQNSGSQMGTDSDIWLAGSIGRVSDLYHKEKTMLCHDASGTLKAVLAGIDLGKSRLPVSLVLFLVFSGASLILDILSYA